MTGDELQVIPVVIDGVSMGVLMGIFLRLGHLGSRVEVVERRLDRHEEGRAA